MTDSLPLHRGEILPRFPSATSPTQKHEDQSQILQKEGEMLSLSTPHCLHTVFTKLLSPEKCGAAPELLAPSSLRKGCCKSV